MKKYILTMLLSVFSQSCSSSDLSYDYLMQHPKKLEEAYKACEFNYTDYCQQIKRAAEDFALLSYARARDPQRFGKNILNLQESIAKLNSEYINLRNAEDLTKAKLVLQDHDEKLKKLQILYAVVAATGPTS